MHAERERLRQATEREKHWKRWGPYLTERAWGNPREDYSAFGTSWDYFTHDHARSRAYRWTEDGIAGICDNHQRLCVALAFWNGRDPILKERLFGLGGPEGNHGEDVKEYYFYLDSTPTHSYMRYLYKYPQSEFPYGQLVDSNRGRSRHESEFELIDTNVFAQDRYFDILRGICQERRRRYHRPNYRYQSWARHGVALSSAYRLVSQYLVLGLRHAASRAISLRFEHG
jgi:hypothetical protein